MTDRETEQETQGQGIRELARDLNGDGRLDNYSVEAWMNKEINSAAKRSEQEGPKRGLLKEEMYLSRGIGCS